MATTTRTFLALVLLVCGLPALAAEQPYRVGPPPPWVSVAPDAQVTSQAKPVEAGDSDFAVVDHQVRLEATTLHYTRYAERLVSQAAVDSAAQVSIDIDPEHERVTLHQVRVFRDGKVIDKLADARRSLLNRESELEDGLINGQVTLHLLLKDVRVGDLLDYSYTSERRDPISERGYFDWFSTQWSSPVRYFRLRVARPTDRELHVSDHGKLGAPKVTTRDGWSELQWEAHDIAALPEESGRPSWHIRYPRIEVSEFASWNAVRDWALPMYRVAATRDAGLDAQVAELRAVPDASARILRALRFVQDDIRYTGLEIGAGAYRPSQPGAVLERRFGDCKDKTLLLVTLLRAVGVQAWPALVHSSFGRGVLDRLPSPGAFDHVIAKVRFDGRDYWLDATASGQGGRLGTLVQADFGPALVLAPGMDGLENMPQRTDSTPTSVVAETFDFRQGTDKSAQFSVHTVYRDEDADSMRVRMRSQTATRLGEDYLDYYRKSYGGIRILQPLRTADDRDANTFTIDERYVIDDPFEKDDDGERTFGLEAYLISDQTQEPDQAVRTSPLARDFPKHVHHEIVAYLPGEWNVENESSSVADSAFEYRFNARFKGGKLELTYDLHNTRDHVPPDALKTFLSKLKKARDDAFYTLTDGDKTAPAAVKPDSSVSTHAVLVTTLILGLVLGVVAVFGLARMPWSLPAAAANAPHGLGGWMALPTLGLIITPLQLLYVIWTWFRDLGGGTAFGLLSAPVQYLLLLELVCIALLLVVGLYTLWLLFTEDSRFPYSFIAVMSVSVLVMIFDVAALVAIGESVRKELESDVRSLFLRLLAAVLWISYMLTSERVRATFVNRSRDGADYRARRVPAVIGEAAQ